MTFIGGSETINSFTMWQKKGPGGHEDMSWEKSNFILTKSVSPSNTPSSQPLQSIAWFLLPAPYFSILCKMADNQVSANQWRRKIHIKMYFAWPYICSQKHTWGGGKVVRRLLRLQPRRHTVIRSASVHRSCQLLPPSEASRCCDACPQTSAVRHQRGRTPSTPPEILIMCREGAMQKNFWS